MSPLSQPTYSIDQAAQILRVSRRTIYNRIADGQLQTIRTLGGSQRVTRTTLEHLRAVYYHFRDKKK